MPHDAAERTDDETPNRKQDGLFMFNGFKTG